MARVSNPLIGASRNKIGNVVFSNWKGIRVLREKPASVANPQTDLQVRQRSAMAQLVVIGRLLLGAFEVSFRQMAVQMSQFNAFIKANLPQAFDFTGPTATLALDRLIVSKGTLIGFEDLEVDSVVGRDVTASWTPNTGGSGANASDQVRMVAISASGDNFAAVDLSATRADGTGVGTVPGSWSLTGARYAFYLVKADQSESSDSENISA